MKKRKFTRGPWKIDQSFICACPEGKDGDWLIVARMPCAAQMVNELNDTEAWECNSYLIAAAPEMFTVLEKLIRNPNDLMAIMAEAQAVLAKAVRGCK